MSIVTLPVACAASTWKMIPRSRHSCPMVGMSWIDLVVHEHHADEDGVLAQRVLELVQVEQAVFLHLEVGHLEALALELAHGVEHGLVLGLHGDEVLAARAVEMRRALDGEVVALGGAAGPDDLARVGVDERGHLRAALLHRLFGLPAPGVAAARRVAEMLAQPGHHRVDDARVARRRRAVVHVDREIGRHVRRFTW
jgi:hypothetical protein